MPQRIVILTGAGVSAESGLGTFRDTDGLWSHYDLADVATPEGFARDPAQVHDFYNLRRAIAAEADPNPAHHALARLEAEWPGEVMIVTQNVDDLHERAGSKTVVHMHGRLAFGLCVSCGHQWPQTGNMYPADLCPKCSRPGVRPDVVWFGEVPYHMDMIYSAVARADLFVSIGTSGEVYPAAGLVEEAAAAGADTLEINLEASRMPGRFDRVIEGPATVAVPAWVAEVLD